ncbi:hypothetical protein C2E21_6177 [Chlorella sorokiniana]|uniref:Ubiquitin-like domain-containing protein n=1 Tax=Chlorella sorokiniana TaxID=3076 RepID=A0A2P6TKR9_CHLSO|nr:hypothetical protein C2E21_6177 [Chlorella sorokiniana]|eukprot:PRW44897.1 hypothetical protein C2E21_6177 [Chlorella sorokiniana]
MADGDLVLSIKNPGRPTAEDFRLALPPSATVRELKAALQERYPGNPAPTTVTAIYAGRVLKDDNAVLSSFIVPNQDPSVPQSLHILPGFAYAPMASPAAAAYSMYQPALQAAYSAALQVLQQQAAASGGPAGTPSTAAASSANTQAGASTSSAAPPAPEAAAAADGAAVPAPPAAPVAMPMPQVYPHQAIAFVPTLIPVPQPVLPAYMTGDAAAQQQQQQQGADGAAPAQQALPPGQLLMAAPMAYQLPYHVAVPQMQQQVFVPGAQLRQRRQQQQQAPGQLPHALANMLRQQQLQHGALPAHLAEALRRHDAAVAAAGGAPGAPGAAVAARVAPGQAQRRPMMNVVVRLNMRALLQLLVLTVVVYQHCPPGRFLMLVGAGLLLYLTATEPVRRFLNRLAGVQQPGAAAPRAAQQQPGQPPAQQQQQPAEGGAAGAAAPGGADQPANAAAAPAVAAGQAAAGAGAAAPAAGEQEGQARQQPVAQGQGQPPAQQAQPPEHPHRGGLLRELQALVVGFFTSLIPGWNVNPDDAAAIAAAQAMFAAEEEEAAAAGIHLDVAVEAACQQADGEAVTYMLHVALNCTHDDPVPHSDTATFFANVTLGVDSEEVAFFGVDTDLDPSHTALACDDPLCAVCAADPAQCDACLEEYSLDPTTNECTSAPAVILIMDAPAAVGSSAVPARGNLCPQGQFYISMESDNKPFCINCFRTACSDCARCSEGDTPPGFCWESQYCIPPPSGGRPCLDGYHYRNGGCTLCKYTIPNCVFCNACKRGEPQCINGARCTQCAQNFKQGPLGWCIPSVPVKRG